MTVIKRAELTVGEVRIIATGEADGDGPVKITHLDISGERITTESLRRLPISVIETAVRWTTDQSDLETFDGRRVGEDPVAFAERVARAYRAAASRSSRPNKVIAEQANVPVSTVRGWVREARLRGLLDVGTQGKAG